MDVNVVDGRDLLDRVVELEKLPLLVLIETEVVVEDVLLHRNRVVLVHVALYLLAPHEQLDRKNQTLLEPNGLSLRQLLPMRERPVEDQSTYPRNAMDHNDVELVQHPKYLVVKLDTAENRQVTVDQLFLVHVTLVHENYVASRYGGGGSHLKIESFHYKLEVIVDLQTSPVRQR
jgi:hypothetical protein